MSSSKLCITLIFLAIQSCFVYGKGSLTFVVDDTASMYDELERIKVQAESIFNVVKYAKEPLFENFVLVTFNESDAQLRTITTDLNEFRKQLANIVTNESYDSKDDSVQILTGIKLAIESSLPFSTLYAFTDASAKDYVMYEDVEKLAINKNIQLNLIMTGSCEIRRYVRCQVFKRLANITGGQLAHTI